MIHLGFNGLRHGVHTAFFISICLELVDTCILWYLLLLTGGINFFFGKIIPPPPQKKRKFLSSMDTEKPCPYCARYMLYLIGRILIPHK
jgi:hypothetical protein